MPVWAAQSAQVVQVIELNLLLADWYDENHRQSLLNKANAKWAREMLYNTRCCTCYCHCTSASRYCKPIPLLGFCCFDDNMDKTHNSSFHVSARHRKGCAEHAVSRHQTRARRNILP